MPGKENVDYVSVACCDMKYTINRLYFIANYVINT